MCLTLPVLLPAPCAHCRQSKGALQLGDALESSRCSEGCRALGLPQLFSRTRWLLEAGESCWQQGELGLASCHPSAGGTAHAEVLLSLPVPPRTQTAKNLCDHIPTAQGRDARWEAQLQDPDCSTACFFFFSSIPFVRTLLLDCEGCRVWEGQSPRLVSSFLCPKVKPARSGTTENPPDQGSAPRTHPPLWPCSLVLQHEAAGLHCSQGTLPWAAVSGCRVPSRTALRVWHCGAGTEGTAPRGATRSQLPALPAFLCCSAPPGQGAPAQRWLGASCWSTGDSNHQLCFSALVAGEALQSVEEEKTKPSKAHSPQAVVLGTSSVTIPTSSCSAWGGRAA